LFSASLENSFGIRRLKSKGLQGFLPSITKEIPTKLKAYYLHWLWNSDSKLVTHPSQVLYFQPRLLTFKIQEVVSPVFNVPLINKYIFSDEKLEPVKERQGKCETSSKS
jgi:hypothetical protein